MKRTHILQIAINKIQGKSYLEVGVHRGNVFLPIRAMKKVAVDPRFEIPLRKKLTWIRKIPSNLFARYYEVTSDHFFSKIIGKQKFDVIFIDGLHTYRQSLQDVVNALRCLNKQGVIVMHDCNPLSEACAYPGRSPEEVERKEIPGWDGRWSGDVWKTIVYLRSFHSDLEVFVLDMDTGLGIIKIGNNDELLDLSLEDVEMLTYRDLAEQRAQLLNLKDLEYFRQSLNLTHQDIQEGTLEIDQRLRKPTSPGGGGCQEKRG